MITHAHSNAYVIAPPAGPLAPCAKLPCRVQRALAAKNRALAVGRIDWLDRESCCVTFCGMDHRSSLGRDMLSDAAVRLNRLDSTTHAVVTNPITTNANAIVAELARAKYRPSDQLKAFKA